MANCEYTLQDQNGNEFVITGIPALKAYLVNGGLEAQFPERSLPRSVAELLGEKPQYSFAGQKAQTADQFSLAQAQSRIESGENPETVRQQTGWFIGEEGKARFEISDKDAKLTLSWFGGVDKFEKAHRNATVGDLLEHPKLYAAYPELAGYRLSFARSSRIGGKGGIIGKHIYLASDQSQSEMRSVLMHELQHAIQKYEGFAVGGAPEAITPENYQEHQKEMLHVLEENLHRYEDAHNQKMADKVQDKIQALKAAANFKAYQRLAGEVEAVNVQKRLNMSPKDRQKVAPSRTAEFRGSDVIVRFNEQDMLNAPAPANAEVNPDAVERFNSAQEATDHLLASTGPGIQTLIDNGVLNFTQGKASWPMENPEASAEAVYLNGKAYIDLNATPKDRLDATVLHEIGEHYGLRRMLGSEGYNSLLNAIRNRAKIKGTVAEKTWKEVKAAYTGLEEGSDAFVSEVVAKLGETNPNVPWYRRLLSQIKSFLLRMGLARGLTAGTVTENDLHELLKTSLKASASSLKKGEGRFYSPNAASAYSVSAGQGTAPKTIPDTITVDGKERPTTNSNGQLIHPTEEGIRNFWRWFGDSKFIDEDGKPVVFYHGSDSVFNVFSTESRGKNYQDSASLNNFFFSSDKDGAGQFGSVVKEYYLRSGRVKTIDNNDISDAISDWLDNLRDNDENEYEFQISTKAYENTQGINKGYELSIQNANESGYASTVYENEYGEKWVTVIDPNQIKSATDNDGAFSPQSPDIRYSLPAAPANAVPPNQYNAAYDTWWAQTQRKMENMADGLFKNRLAVFTAHQLTELGQYIMPGLKQYDKLLLAREATVAEWMRSADQLVSQVWKDIPKPMQFALSGVMHDSTLADVDASKGWRFVEPTDETKSQYRAATQAKLGLRTQRLLAKAAKDAGAIRSTKNSAIFASEKQAQAFLSQIEGLENRQRLKGEQAAQKAQRVYVDPNAERITAHAALQPRYAQLSDPAKQVYSESNQKHQALFNERLATLEQRIEDAVLNVETRSKMIAEVRRKFESASLNWYYAPLSRFGDHWFYGKDANGKNWFVTAESVPARDRKMKEFEQAGGKVANQGTNFRGVDQALGLETNDSFVTNVLNVVDSERTMEDEARDQLKDEIYQLYLSTLPDVSVRHSSMHRKGTLGFDADAMRSFSNAMHHGATQLANMKYSRPMKQVLADHEDALAIANSTYRKEAAEREVEAAEMLRDDWDNLSQPGELENQLKNAKKADEKALLEQAITLRNRFGKFGQIASAMESIQTFIDSKNEILKAAGLIQAKHSTKAAHLLEELGRSYQAAMNTNSTSMDRVVTKINQLNFIGMLGFGLSSSMVNTLQTPGVAMPVVIGRHGITDTLREFNQSFKEFMSAFMRQKKDADGNTSITEILREALLKAAAANNTRETARLINELNALEQFKQDGTISRTQTFDIIGVGQEGSDYGGVLSDWSKKAGFLFHHGERFNREVTLLAAYRLESARLQKENQKRAAKDRLKLAQIHQQATDYAKYVVDRSHLDYSAENAARLFRGPLAKLAFQFKKYQQGMLFLWGKAFADSLRKLDRADYATPALFEQAQQEQREARRTFMGLLAMQSSLAGLTSLPLMGALSVVYGLMGQAAGDDDEPWDLERDLRLGLAYYFGDAAAETMAKGIVNTATPINLSSRLDQSNLFFREPMVELEGRDAATNYVAQVFGPTGGTVEKAWQGLSFLADGQVMRGAEQLLPKFISDLVKAARFGLEDATSLHGDKVKDISAEEIFWQTLGFGSSSLERKYAERGYAKAREKAITETREAIIHDAVESRLKGEAVDRSAIDAWNYDHPEYPITGNSIQASLRSKREGIKRKGDRGYSVNPKLEYLYEENDLMD